MIADRARLRTMLASLARTLHVGPLADCFFDPATALCLNRITEPGPPAPMIATSALKISTFPSNRDVAADLA